jgi:hypothetical protein
MRNYRAVVQRKIYLPRESYEFKNSNPGLQNSITEELGVED